MIARQTAKKTALSHLMKGSWVKKEGMEPSFVTTALGENISRARILGTVVARFDSEDGNYSSVTVDDGSDTVRVKAFKEIKILEKLRPGDMIDVVGKVREYTGEIYMIPESIRKVDDPNAELLRRLEIIKKIRGLKRAKEMVEQNRSKYSNSEELKKFLTDQGIEACWIDIFLNTKSKSATSAGGTPEADKNSLRKEILKVIEAGKDGIVYSALMGKVKAKETEIESVINELLSEGICYEPTPGKIRKI
ncbi:MAG: hypothetical protein JW754_02870 [Candidatus Aenigmarchaeota archaeon]|nr:hypothetical protein [Candidatus Aenigmarchaeota archaeon]